MNRRTKYRIVTFGCAANTADSERIAAMLEARGMTKAKDLNEAEHLIINACMVRQQAEDRVYGLVENIRKSKIKNQKSTLRLRSGLMVSVPRLRSGLVLSLSKDEIEPSKIEKIVVTGCMVGVAIREKSGKFYQEIRKRMPEVEFMPIEEVGFDNAPVRSENGHGLVPISNGCNNFCAFCVVPFSRGQEISRPFEDIVAECQYLAETGFGHITLIGQNVNSYGADLILGGQKRQNQKAIGYRLPSGMMVKPVIVKHLGKHRLPTLFPYLLSEVCGVRGIKKVDFISANPWDFSDELIEVIAKNPKISKDLHLPVQAGDDKILERMNRWYSVNEYLNLLDKIRQKIPNARISTDIIVGFPDESVQQFENTVRLAQKAQFFKAYIAMYSDRPATAAHEALKDSVPHQEKKRRWQILENLINQDPRRQT